MKDDQGTRVQTGDCRVQTGLRSSRVTVTSSWAGVVVVRRCQQIGLLHGAWLVEQLKATKPEWHTRMHCGVIASAA